MSDGDSTGGRSESSDSTADDGAETGGSLTDRAAAAADPEVSEWLSLEPDEEVVWVGEPTKLRMVGTLVTGVVLIPVLIGILILLFSPLSYLGIKHTDYVVTTRSLYVKQGILSTNIESVDLDRIQNTEFTQSFWGKQLGFGTIEISTAGSAGADISFDDVEDARDVREEISRVQREFGGGGGRDGTGGGGRSADRQAASADQLEQLVAELRATREALERVEARMADGADPSTADPDRRADDAEGAETDSSGSTDGIPDAGDPFGSNGDGN
ncbi:PH domain-containing protein [Halosimplex marinum]|uniref:PH domain-containing protein n=1 Tax=Halosimplex marinum TaxID=3396620 RepID=UPI003F55AF7E